MSSGGGQGLCCVANSRTVYSIPELRPNPLTVHSTAAKS